ncbi:MAG TPA: cyclic nucleotide-binding domain-containing protein [Leptospiraceae bacterium]|nr:cyclic nucleotide-binding domain-containing protein [Leptospiraceae bacterium]HMY68528.1 cyclic nucleotide-binding domain-containing protein [Leptospiraceae bacterium]HNF14974.1 cyclic nucleotide-binding domain-containing protein [Leptospiraceae bacterium]HNF24348.1 cyclic nucleotide-binding domain-containing protein [Leptospiraceae bacterium]HNH07325.1 cyclic nucleotide-binding domain-containing protein [Leptospiraceae bacterium]
MSGFQAKDTELLRNSAVLKGLSEMEIKQLLDSSELKTGARNDILLNEWEIGRGIFIILEGEVEVYLPKQNKRGIERISEVKVSRLKSGDCFGEYSLIDEGRISASVRVVSQNFRASYINQKDFQSFSEIHHKSAKIIYRNLLEIFIARLRGNLEELDMVYVIH